MLIPYSQFEKIPKGPIAKYGFKEPKSIQMNSSSRGSFQSPKSASKKGTISEVKTKRRKRKPLTRRKVSKNSIKAPPKVAEVGMVEGKKYYIEGSRTKKNENKTVYMGTFVEMYKSNDEKWLKFKDVETLVHPLNISVSPFGFSMSDHRFTEVLE